VLQSTRRPATPSDLSPKLNELIAQELSLGHYSSEEELLTEALHLLSQRDALRKQIQIRTTVSAARSFPFSED